MLCSIATPKAQTNLIKLLQYHGPIIDSQGWLQILQTLFQCKNTNKMQTTIFQNANQYSDNLLVVILDSLNSLTIKDWEEAYQFVTLCVEKNLYRIDIFWELLTAHYLTLTNSKHSHQRLHGTNTLSHFIIKGFEYLAKYFKLKPFHESEWKQKLEFKEKALQ